MPLNKPHIPILCYHRVAPRAEWGAGSPSLCVTPQQFYRQLWLLDFLGYRTLSPQDLVAIARQKKLPPKKSVLITFDDGYADNYFYALPILKKFRMKATVFLVTSALGKTNFWDGGTLKLLNTSQILEMEFYGIHFGSHTHTHADFSKGTASQIRSELVESKKILEQLLSKTEISFCYPYARKNTEGVRLVQETGYLCAFAGDDGTDFCLGNDTALFNLRRVQIFPNTTLNTFWMKLQSWYFTYRNRNKR